MCMIIMKLFKRSFKSAERRRRIFSSPLSSHDCRIACDYQLDILLLGFVKRYLN